MIINLPQSTLNNKLKNRILILAIFITLFFCFLYFRLFQIPFFKLESKELVSKAAERIFPLKTRLGLVKDTNGKIILNWEKSYSVYALPSKINDARLVASNLSGILCQSPEVIKGKIFSNPLFCWLARDITDYMSRSIELINLKGIKLIPEWRRIYPRGSLMEKIYHNSFGFALEKYYQNTIGRNGEMLVIQADRRGHCKSKHIKFQAPQWDIILNMDEALQQIIWNELNNSLIKNNAKSAAGMVFNPKNGAVLALVTINGQSIGIKEENLWGEFYPGRLFSLVPLVALFEQRPANGDRELLKMEKSNIAYSFLTHFEEKSALSLSRFIETETINETLKKLGFSGINTQNCIDLCLPKYDIPTISTNHRELIDFLRGFKVKTNIFILARGYSSIINEGVMQNLSLVKALSSSDNGFTIKKIIPVRNRAMDKSLADAILKIYLKTFAGSSTLGEYKSIWGISDGDSGCSIAICFLNHCNPLISIALLKGIEDEEGIVAYTCGEKMLQMAAKYYKINLPQENLNPILKSFIACSNIDNQERLGK